jgi:putative hydrolase of the HAD superfamily
MGKYNNIKAILFDSGRVLNHPRTGNWFIPPNLHNIVDISTFKQLDHTLLEKALNKAMNYLLQQKLILTEAEEFMCFKKFYKIIFQELIDLKLTEEQITEIAKDTVYNDEKFFFPDDVFEIIPILCKSYKLGVISDTWPSLHRVFRNVGLRDYFSTFIMSSVLGVSKPHVSMYRTALDELNVNPEEAIFIDDNINNLKGAEKLGIHTILIDRSKQDVSENNQYQSISNLYDLQKLLIK